MTTNYVDNEVEPRVTARFWLFIVILATSILIGLVLWRLSGAPDRISASDVRRFVLRDGRTVQMSQADLDRILSRMNCAAGERAEVDARGYVLKFACSRG